MTMEQCPKFDSCSAPICPLDPDWSERKHIKDEPVCYYLREWAKHGPHSLCRGGEEHIIASTLTRVYPQILSSIYPLKKQLDRITKTANMKENYYE